MSLKKTLEKSPEDLLIPNEKLKKDALKLVKSHIDPIAKDYSIFDQIHVDGLDADQVWGQVQMVIDGAIEKLMNNEMSSYLRLNGVKNDDVDEDMEDDDEDMEEEDEEEALENEEYEEEEGSENEEEVDYDENIENSSDLENNSNLQDDYEESDMESDIDTGKPSELDDEIFKLKDFQKQVLALENEDDDEGEEIDYGASHFGEEDDEEEEDDADARYEDFFAPPKKSKKASKKNVRFDVSKEEKNDQEMESIDDNIEDLMTSSKQDLFADEEEDSEDDKKENLSNFELQQREILKQIQQFEQENVGEKKWEVRGEVKASDRPTDSLIEADLEFDRNTKAAPVITQEVTDSLEDIIRRRIKAKDFDDLPRRMPDLLPEFKPSRTVELQETKSSKSLAELYEEDYVKENNADTYKDAETEKISNEHQEIERLFNELSSKLDSLSSWNYTPKRPEPTISIVSEAPAISMEEAQPTAMSSESRLAPQELYTTTIDGKREIVGPDGVPVSKSEMDREDRKRQRRKQKAQKAKSLKARDLKRQAIEQKTGSKANVISTLKKGNVTIIGKNGEKRDVSGKIKKDYTKPKSSNIKL